MISKRIKVETALSALQQARNWIDEGYSDYEVGMGLKLAIRAAVNALLSIKSRESVVGFLEDEIGNPCPCKHSHKKHHQQ